MRCCLLSNPTICSQGMNIPFADKTDRLLLCMRFSCGSMSAPCMIVADGAQLLQLQHELSSDALVMTGSTNSRQDGEGKVTLVSAYVITDFLNSHMHSKTARSTALDEQISCAALTAASGHIY